MDKEAKELYDKYEKEATSRNINFVCVDKFQIDKNREKQVNEEPEKEQKNEMIFLLDKKRLITETLEYYYDIVNSRFT